MVVLMLRSRTNLPPPSAFFVGRERTLKKLQRYLDAGEHVVTLVGPEGTGKSTVGRRFASLLSADTAMLGGVWACDLSGAHTVEEVCHVVADALQVELHADTDVATFVGEALRVRGPTLLLLDGADDAREELGALVERWHQLVPQLVMLLTAREPLGIEPEIVVKVGALRVPSLKRRGVRLVDDGHSAEEPSQSEAVQLFIQRAREAVRGYAPTERDLSSIAEIVRRLEGLPLAIELAAARVGTLSPGELLERLPRTAALLRSVRSGEKNKPAHKTNVTYTIDWSWGLLAPWERSALAQSTVFRGGFSLEAAEAVIDLSTVEGAPPVAEVLSSLSEKSLLLIAPPPQKASVLESLEQQSEESPSLRYSHYSSVRDFAEDHLRQSGSQAAYHRHTRYFVEVGGALAAQVDGVNGRSARRALCRDYENLLAVVRRGLSADPGTHHSITTALSAVLILDPVLSTRGPHAIHLDLLDAVIAPAEAVGVDLRLRARVHEARGRARRARGLMDASLDDLNLALKLSRTAEDRLLEGRALANIGTHHLFLGEFDLAERHYDQAIVALREVGARHVEGRALAYFGRLRRQQGRAQEARALFEQALAIHQETGDLRHEGITRGVFGALLFDLGAFDDAKDELERALAIHKAVGNRRFIGTVLAQMANVAFEQGELEQASTLLKRAIEIHRRVFDRRAHGEVLTTLGDLRLDQGEQERARRHYRHALELARQVGHRRAEGLLLARGAALDAAALKLDEAEAKLKQAKEVLSVFADPALAEALKLYQGHLAFARARQASAAGDATEAKRWKQTYQSLINRALTRTGDNDDSPALADRSDDVRSALRSLVALRMRAPVGS